MLIFYISGIVRKIEIEDVLCELEAETPIESKTKELEEKVGQFDEQKPIEINIGKSLAEFIRHLDLKQTDNRFNRVVFYVAVVLIRNSNVDKITVDGAGAVEEDGQDFGTRLLEGSLSLIKLTLTLYIKTTEEVKLKYSSFKSEQMIKDLLTKNETKQPKEFQPKVSQVIPKVAKARKRTDKFKPLISLSQLTPIFTSPGKEVPMRLKNSITTYKDQVDIEAELTNLTDLNVFVPKNSYSAYYFHVKIYDDNGNKLKATRHHKIKDFSEIEPKVELKPNQTHKLPPFSLNSEFGTLAKYYLNSNWKLESQLKADYLCFKTEQVYNYESNVCIDDLLFTSDETNTESESVSIPSGIQIFVKFLDI